LLATALSIIRTGPFRIAISSINILLAVSAVFMTQSIFLEISQSFSIHITDARLSFSIVSLFYSIAFFFLGPAMDKYDLPKIAVSGLALQGLSILFASYAPGFDTFVITMAMIGICSAIIAASMFTYVSKTAPKDKIGVYVGSIVASGTLGVIFGRVIMGLMTAGIGWHFAFMAMALVLFALAGLSYFSLAQKKEEKVNNHKSLFILYKNTIGLIWEPKILALLLAGCSLFFGFLGMVTFLTYRLVEAPFHFASGEVGWVSFAGITALIAPFSGNISKKIGSLKIIFSSLLICLLSFQLMGWLDSIALIVLGLLLLFLGVYACQPLLFLFIGESVPPESLGSASSLYIFFCIGGGSLSSILLGPIWHSYGWSGITLACSGSLLACLLLMAYAKSRGLGSRQAV
jgi:YNFM family putative membrane transporter